MQTRKLYYEDCHLRSFTAKVLSCEPTEKGFWVVLDATAFYPEGGGQGCDLGTLGQTRVLDVQEQGEEIWHLCAQPLTVGAEVTGNIDWERRFDFMQQHTGEHILSGLIYEAYGYHNTGFHVGAEVMEVDFDGVIDPQALWELEAKANRAIWENIALNCWIPSPEELSAVTYRTKRALPWPVRIVEVPGYDSCACCGVHVARTGEVGLIKILSCVKLRQGIRLEMVCGSRAYGFVQRIFEQNRQVSQCFSAKMEETAAAAEKISEALAKEKYKNTFLQGKLFAFVAESYVNQTEVLHFHDQLSAAEVRRLAEQIGEKCAGLCAVFSGEGDTYSYCLISKDGSAASVGAALRQALCGRGGGKPDAQQGTVHATKEAIESFFGKK